MKFTPQSYVQAYSREFHAVTHVLSRFFPDDHAFQIWEDANEEFGGSSDEVVSWTVSFGLANSENHRGNDHSAD